MIYRLIPGTDLRASMICLGTVPFGSSISANDAFRLLDAFVDCGGTFIDTAHIYADWASKEKAISEKTIGRWLKRLVARDGVVLGTKGAHPLLGSREPRLSPAEIRKDLEESLADLQVDRIDLYWLHRDDPGRPVAEILETLEAERRAGRIRYYGCSNWRVERIQEARAHAAARGWPGFVANQMMWSLADPKPGSIADPTLVAMDPATYSLHGQTGMAAVPYTSQAKGFFGGAYGRDVRNPGARSAGTVVSTYYHEQNFHRLDRVRELAQKLGRSPNDVALAYLASQPFPTFPIVGCRTVEQVQGSCAAGDLVLSPEEAAGLVA